jgi:apolipoprotein N-acyltransferase
MVVLLTAAGYGVLTVTAPLKDPITVRTTLVQPNVSQVDAWSGQMGPQIYQRLRDYTRLYAEARDAKSDMDLVIWPESALPVHLHDLPDHVAYFDELLKAGDFSLLTGTEIDEPNVGGHVSAVLFKGSFANRQEHHKIHLVPFGEYLPLRSIPPFSFLKGLFPGDFMPGTSMEPLKLAKPEVQIIPLICFEDTVGRLARRFVRPEPQMIVNITNDGWFLQSEQTEVHAVNAKFRAIELRRPMVRATNTGVTCFIDTLGTVTQTLADPATGSTFIEGCLPGEVKVPRVGVMTLYARYGDWFAMSCLLICLGCLVFRRFA